MILYQICKFLVNSIMLAYPVIFVIASLVLGAIFRNGAVVFLMYSPVIFYLVGMFASVLIDIKLFAIIGIAIYGIMDIGVFILLKSCFFDPFKVRRK